MLAHQANGSAQAAHIQSLPLGGESHPLDIPRTIPDRRLRVRGNPDFSGHDARGLRNPAGAAWPELVVLGDGHVYGAGVGADQCWPRRL
jgi:hypothetical protein